jgi:hypothetical protein
MILLLDCVNTLHSAVAGDGYCSLWAVLLGVAILYPKKTTVFDPTRNKVVPIRTMRDLVEVVLRVLKNIKEKIEEQVEKEQGATYELNPGDPVSKLEVENMEYQLRRNCSTIEGRAQLQVLAFLFCIRIEVYDSVERAIHVIGDPQGPTIYIRTDQVHYNLCSIDGGRLPLALLDHPWFKAQGVGHYLDSKALSFVYK